MDQMKNPAGQYTRFGRCHALILFRAEGNMEGLLRGTAGEGSECEGDGR